jgi:ribosome maturation factor RimP
LFYLQEKGSNQITENGPKPVFVFFKNNNKLLKNKIKKTYKKNEKAGSSVGIPDERLDTIRSMADTLCESEGMELVHVEYLREPMGRILRVYIDKPGGVGIDDCMRISRQLSDLLDVYLDSDAAYHLEVSSPGPQRPLGKAADFEKYRGQEVRIKTRETLDGKKKFYGKLLGICEGMVKLQMDNQIVEISHQAISQAKLVNNDGEIKC